MKQPLVLWIEGGERVLLEADDFTESVPSGEPVLLRSGVEKLLAACAPRLPLPVRAAETEAFPQPHSSVELSSNAKGRIQVTVKTYASSPQDAADMALRVLNDTKQKLGADFAQS